LLRIKQQRGVFPECTNDVAVVKEEDPFGLIWEEEDDDGTTSSSLAVCCLTEGGIEFLGLVLFSDGCTR
jgi:hypothetical protein